MAQLIAEEGPLSITEPVVMEVLAGARTDQRELDLRRLLLRFRLLCFDAASDFDSAARMYRYRRCRAAGITPRGMVDCMIAAVAWRHGASLLVQDVDLVHLCQIVGITLDQASVGT
jgi:predicted nucleic acid-binding protein